ncbi:MAG: CBS domain-containing protein [Candidatus Pacearchaeota archaeon]
MKVSEIMHEVEVISPKISLREAAVIMSEKEIGSLVVIEEEKIVGIITERDILKNIGKLGEKVEKIMSKNVLTIEEDKNIDKAIEIMRENKIKRLPVTRDRKLVGIVTVTDILANSEEINEEFLFD